MSTSLPNRFKAACVALFSFALLGGASRALAHGVQVAYGTTPTGFLRIYIEHWHGDETVALLGSTNNINVTVTTGTTSSTFNVNVTGVVNSTTLNNLPGLVGPIHVLSTTSLSNTYNDWGYWDFAPGSCNQPVTVTVNQGNTVIFQEAEAQLYPATISAQTFTDQAPPVITAPNITVVGDCTGANVAFSGVTIVDDCDKNPAVSYSRASGSFFPVGTTPVTVTATDNTGKTSVKTFNVTVAVGDSTPPSLTVPQPITAFAAAGQCGANIVFASLLSATDNCSATTITSVPASGSFFPVGTTTVTATARDASGNATSKTFTVTIKDNQAPTITAPADLALSAGAGCTAVANFAATASDNCPGVTISYSKAPGSAFPVGTTVVTATATDASGNTASATFSVVVADTTAPTITTAAANKSVESDGTNAAIAAWLAANGGAAATDTCSAVTWSNNFSGLTGGCGATGSATVVFTATDAAGNTATTSATFTVVDTTAPTITTVAASKTVECDGAGNTAALGAWLASNGGATATDAGSGVTWSNNFTALAGNSATVVFTAKDACGNAASTTATFAIVDTTKPVLTAASNQTVESDGAGNTAALAAWLASNGGATATDACSGVTWANNFTALTKGCGSTGSATVTFTATDSSGNAASTTATFAIVDTTKPAVVAASNNTVEADGAGNTAALAAWLASNGGATATDVGSSVTWSNNFTALTKGCGSTGSATVTFTATDACGNASSTTATFAIVDTTKPAVAAASNKTVESDGAGNTAALAAWLANNGGATATDVGSSVTWSNNFTALVKGCGATGSATVTFTATDACGNASTTTATFAIVDTTKPAVAAASNKTVESDGAGNLAALGAWLASNGGATATDVGSAVTWSNNYTGTSFVTSCGTAGAATVTFTATDACGNASTTTATFTIVDTTKPTIASNVHDISPNIKPDVFVVTSTDIGGGATPSIVKVTATRLNPQGKLQDFTSSYQHTVTGNKLSIDITGGVGTVWTIYGSSVDACGNTTTATYVVNVVNPTVTK